MKPSFAREYFPVDPGAATPARRAEASVV